MFPEPTTPAPDRAHVLTGYLDHFRDTAIAKTTALDPADRTHSRLPSGWTPDQLLHHLRHVERRWITWGWQGRHVGDPWADRAGDRWHVPAGTTHDTLVAALREQGSHTTAVAHGNDLDRPGAPGPRWNGAPPATLERVLLHLVQEYARHLGHLDIITELAGGPTGE